VAASVSRRRLAQPLVVVQLASEESAEAQLASEESAEVQLVLEQFAEAQLVLEEVQWLTLREAVARQWQGREEGTALAVGRLELCAGGRWSPGAPPGAVGG
jgi:hypothetical protein